MSPNLHQHVAQARIDDFTRAANRQRMTSELRSPRHRGAGFAGMFRRRSSVVDTIGFAVFVRRFAR